MTKPIITREAFPFWHTIEVRWGDMDAMGHVNNAVYFTYLESARIALLRSLDIRGRAEGSQFGPTLVATSCDYKKEVRYPVTLDLGVRVTRLTQRSFAMEYAMFFHDTDEVAAIARSVNAWVDYAAKKAIPLPDELREALSVYCVPIAQPAEFAAEWERTLFWLEQNKNDYAGRWVALDGDRLLVTGNSAREVYAALKTAGISGSFVTRVEHPDDLPVIE